MNTLPSPGLNFSRPSSCQNLREASQLLIATSLCGTGAMILLPATADAAIVATPGISPATPLTVPYNIDGVYLNVLNGAAGSVSAAPGWDINPYGSQNLSWFSQSNVTGGSLARYSSTGATTAGSLDLSTLVDAATTYTNLTAAVTYGTAPGEWKLSAPNYFGFQFFHEGDNAVHYGWGILTLGSGPSTGTRTLTNVYYESQPGVGIIVGTVPEPSSSLLAAGAVGIALLRRRRAAA